MVLFVAACSSSHDDSSKNSPAGGSVAMTSAGASSGNATTGGSSNLPSGGGSTSVMSGGGSTSVMSGGVAGALSIGGTSGAISTGGASAKGGSSGVSGNAASAGISGAISTGGTSAKGGGSGVSGNAASAGISGAISTGGTSAKGGSSGVSGNAASAGISGAISTGGTSAKGGNGSMGSTAGTTSTDDIGTWTDAPGACPGGMTPVDVTSESELEDATRGDGKYASDPPSACYYIHNGRYAQSGSTLSMFVTKSGTDAAHRRVFVGESRTGVIVNGRVSIDSGVSHVRISNLTFDLTGFSQTGSFNTLTMLADSTDLRVDHVTFTGDCRTGANGGHVEVDGSTDVIVEDCLIEKFGRCGPDGHQDHGVYLASGSNITIRNNDIRGNASRGIQLNTQNGDYGTLDTIVLERNRIHGNGHADYEDGIAMNATGTGTISNVGISRNLIYGNYYSGIREVGSVFRAVAIRNNTLYQNGTASSGSGRSEVNLDDVGSGAETSITRNIIVAANKVLNNCYDSQPRNYALTDNVVQGTAPSGTSGNCVAGSVSANPSFSDAANADFHTQNTAVADYGAYAP
jgi:hypothetical protein